MWIRTWYLRKAGKGRKSGARTAAVWLAAGALVLGACGGADTDDPPAGQTSQAPASAPAEEGAEAVSAASEPADTNAEPEDGAAEGEPESLSDYLGFDYQDPDAAAVQFAEAERRAQEMIALCMAREGFEYIPVNPANAPGAVQVIGDDSEEYAREYGFGITTWYGSGESDGRAPGTEDDPNQAIQTAMSESEREAYMEALYGPPVADDEGAESFEGEVIFGGGCRGGAYQEVQGQLLRMMQLLGPSLQELGERIQADPRVAESEEGWSACMADRGYRYETQDEMYTEAFSDFGDRLDEIIGPGGGAVDPFEGWTEEEVEIFLAENSEQAIEDFYEQAQSEARAGVDQEALAALQQEERDLASANTECGRDLLAVYDEVWPEYEQGFIDENREQLAQVRDG